MASSSTTLISSSTRVLLPAKSSLPSLSLSFLPTLSSPSALASLRFARPSSLTSIRSTSRQSFARPFVVVSLNVELILDETNGEHHVKTCDGLVSVVVYGDQEKPALIIYPNVALNYLSCFQGLFLCPEAVSLLLHNFCIYHISPPGHEHPHGLNGFITRSRQSQRMEHWEFSCVTEWRKSYGGRQLSEVSLPRFTFSCATQGLSLPIAGVLGLSPAGEFPFWRQVTRAFNVIPKFALCLPSSVFDVGHFYVGGVNGYIIPPFNGSSNPIPITLTPLKNIESGKYIISPESIYVDGVPLSLNPSLLEGGAKISTVVPYTVLQTDIYNALASAFTLQAKVLIK
ncbi:hypothetical protein DY000_02018497 [Brassica cretica]|uniref:Xylanase inhibitor C-terminal domain-containing protein n=1 Tax=Brassica cretica TaxID=69181 RepID=A0ABQ7CMS2_BRACR|nr:hypothetical protein DY000_02018497 [Brassica cretica]